MTWQSQLTWSKLMMLPDLPAWLNSDESHVSVNNMKATWNNACVAISVICALNWWLDKNGLSYFIWQNQAIARFKCYLPLHHLILVSYFQNQINHMIMIAEYDISKGKDYYWVGFLFNGVNNVLDSKIRKWDKFFLVGCVREK